MTEMFFRFARAALVGVKIATALAALCGYAAGQSRFALEDRSGPSLESPESDPQSAQEAEGASHDAAVHRQSDQTHPPDLRPLITVYHGDPRTCHPCARFVAWHNANARASDSPFRFQVVARIPGWCERTPAFVFRDSSGRDRVSYGWSDIDTLTATFQRNNPAWQRASDPIETRSPRVDGSRAATLPHCRASPGGVQTFDDFRRQLGAGGTFQFIPASPINATVKDGLTVRIRELRGKYDAAKNEIVFDAPVPEGTATFFGWNVGYKILGARLETPNVLAVRTNWRTIRVTIDEGGGQ